MGDVRPVIEALLSEESLTTQAGHGRTLVLLKGRDALESVPHSPGKTRLNHPE